MSLIMNTPLEQFFIVALIPYDFTFFFRSLGLFVITNFLITLVVVFFFIFFLFFFNTLQFFFIKTRWQFINIKLINFVRTMLVENIGIKYGVYFNILLFLFMFILVMNLFGMVPYCFTISSHLINTLTLSFSFFIGLNIIGIKKHGFEMFSLFLPSGAPLVIAPFLIIIEIISYISRLFSLAIRLFANMMSGHTLLNILSNFGWTMLNLGGLISLIFVIPVLIVFLVTGLEIVIAILQAYVFIILICIYLNDILYLH